MPGLIGVWSAFLNASFVSLRVFFFNQGICAGVITHMYSRDEQRCYATLCSWVLSDNFFCLQSIECGPFNTAMCEQRELGRQFATC